MAETRPPGDVPVDPMSGAHETVDCDVLVIGAGGAGLRAAIAAAQEGATTTVVTKSLLGKAHTVMAEGGIAVALGAADAEDSWEAHFADTMLSGRLLGDWRMTEIFAREVAERVAELERWGGLFDRTPDGRMLQRAFGAHTHRRLCHVGDRTGLELLRTLQERLMAMPAITVAAEHTVIELLTTGGEVVGAVGYRRADGGFVVHRAGAVVLASGGGGRVYRHTSNSWEGVGDGVALALGAGAELVDMEFMQFHPTGMVWPPSARGLLVTEAVRGEGGHLLDRHGRRFMVDYDAARMELSSRDVVARAIHQEVGSGRGTAHGGVLLDVRHLGARRIRRALPSMCQQFEALASIDITREPMEVGPTVHYTMGGVRVDPETAATSVPGLFAAGEVTGGLHGANRLGGNSLGDLLVFGRRAGTAAAARAGRRQGGRGVDGARVRAAIHRMLAPLQPADDHDHEKPHDLQAELQDAMQEGASIARTQESLERALAVIGSLAERSSRLRVGGGRAFNPGWHACRDLGCMLTFSEAVVRSALERRESLGAHWRTDEAPAPADGPQGSGAPVRTVVAGGAGRMAVRLEPVGAMPEAVEARLALSAYGRAVGR